MTTSVSGGGGGLKVSFVFILVSFVIINVTPEIQCKCTSVNTFSLRCQPAYRLEILNHLSQVNPMNVGTD